MSDKGVIKGNPVGGSADPLESLEDLGNELMSAKHELAPMMGATGQELSDDEEEEALVPAKLIGSATPGSFEHEVLESELAESLSNLDNMDSNFSGLADTAEMDLSASNLMETECPDCDANLAVPASSGGRLTMCPSCESTFRIPAKHTMLEDAMSWRDMAEDWDDVEISPTVDFDEDSNGGSSSLGSRLAAVMSKHDAKPGSPEEEKEDEEFLDEVRRIAESLEGDDDDEFIDKDGDTVVVATGLHGVVEMEDEDIIDIEDAIAEDISAASQIEEAIEEDELEEVVDETPDAQTQASDDVDQEDVEFDAALDSGADVDFDANNIKVSTESEPLEEAIEPEEPAEQSIDPEAEVEFGDDLDLDLQVDSLNVIDDTTEPEIADDASISANCPHCGVSHQVTGRMIGTIAKCDGCESIFRIELSDDTVVEQADTSAEPEMEHRVTPRGVLVVNCPDCGADRRVPDNLAGNMTWCRECQTVFRVDRRDTASEAPKSDSRSESLTSREAAMIAVMCPGCGRTATVPESSRDGLARCSSCQGIFRVPLEGGKRISKDHTKQPVRGKKRKESATEPPRTTPKSDSAKDVAKKSKPSESKPKIVDPPVVPDLETALVAQCPKCAEELLVPPKAVGRKAQCMYCEHIFRVPRKRKYLRKATDVIEDLGLVVRDQADESKSNVPIEGISDSNSDQDIEAAKESVGKSSSILQELSTSTDENGKDE